MKLKKQELRTKTIHVHVSDEEKKQIDSNIKILRAKKPQIRSLADGMRYKLLK